MREIDWKAKLTSRKFWVAVTEFVSMLIIAFHGSQETATQVAALIMAGAAVIAYIIGEGLADAAGVKNHFVFSGDFGANFPMTENNEADTEKEEVSEDVGKV